ncbi:MAG: S8 family serine peptidase [bacterium]|nr:S8 family serine peptidase [bacterium]
MSHRAWMILGLVLGLTAGGAIAGSVDRWSSCNFTQGQLIVTFSDDIQINSRLDEESGVLSTNSVSLNDIFREFDVTQARRLVPDGILSKLRVAPDFYRTYLVSFREDYPALNVLSRLESDPGVIRVEPNVVYRIRRIPNDALWSSQWDKRIVGAPAVWDVTVGSSELICVGIDTGIDWNHPDLTPNLWVNPGEDLDGDGVAWTDPGYPGDYDDLNGTDDDGNGYRDDFLGWDFIYGIGNCATGEDCDSQMDNDVFGLHPHGTHVGGIMAARGDNNVGMAGMCWVGRLMGVRAGYLDREGEGGIPASAELPAILYAVANGARVINMSYGGGGSSGYSEEVMNAAWDAGAILFAASGNDGSTEPQYPAAYENVIAVNSTEDNDRLSWWSNRGTWTDLCSPGSGIMSTVINSYGTMSGTSMASPNAAGVAALVWSLFPEMTNAQLRDLLLNTAQSITAQNPGIPASYLGHGRVDAENAVASFYPQLEVTEVALSDVVGGDGDGRLERGESGRLVITCANVPGWADGNDISMIVSTDAPFVTISDDSVFLGAIPSGQSADNAENPVIVAAAAELDTAFWAELRVTFSSPAGYRTTRTIEVRVGRGAVLLVDDDGGMEYQSYYESAITDAGAAFDVWTVLTESAVPVGEISQYNAVIWHCGNQSWQTLTAEDQTVLSAYLDGGGNLIVAGQNIDEDIATTVFYRDYLHAQSENLGGNRQLSGVTDNPVSAGMSLLLQGGGCASNSTSPSRVLPVNGGEALFTYSEGGVGATLYSGDYRTAYFAFALEAACGLGGTTHHQDVIADALRWMGTLAAPPVRPRMTPAQTALLGNYPNPFNASTRIAFDVAASGRVTLDVFDVLGRRVAQLINAPMAAGTHEISFRGDPLPSGVYVIRLQAAGVERTRRMLLIK